MIFNMVLPGVLLLGVVIFVHELGHFLAAKWRKVKVIRFSLGFGPAIFAFTHGETEYRISWIPLGGYVQMAGDTPADDGTMPSEPSEFLSHPWYGRIVILLGGPMANLATAFVVLVVSCLAGMQIADYPNVLGSMPDSSFAVSQGLKSGDRITAVAGQPVNTWVNIFAAVLKVPTDQDLVLTAQRGDSSFKVTASPEMREPLLSSVRRPADPPIVGGVMTGMPAYKAGLKEGDRVLAVNGSPITAWEQLPVALENQVDKPVRMTIERNGRTFDVSVKPISPDGERDGRRAQIGIEMPRHAVYLQRQGLLRSIDFGFRATGALIVNVYGGMWMTVSRPLYYREYLGGPLFIAQAASEQARRGFDAYLQFLAMINVAIMAFNLLPIPVLDGGHIALALFQALRGQALSAGAYMRFQKAGLVVVGTLFILILANDPLRIVQRQRALDKAPQEGPVAPGPP